MRSPNCDITIAWELPRGQPKKKRAPWGARFGFACLRNQ